MSIVGISDNWQSLLAGLDIEQILRKKKGDEIIPEAGADLLNARDSLAAEIAAERHNVGAGNGSNPLDRNFVRQDREESRYVSATLKGFKAEREMDQARQNSTTALLEEFGGVKVSGTTIFMVDEGVDTGHILAQSAVDVLPVDTEATLHERIKVVERELLVQVVNELAKESNV